MKEIATVLLNVLLFPIGAIASGLIVACFILCFPGLVLGFSIEVSGLITQLLVAKFFSRFSIAQTTHAILLSNALLIPATIPFTAVASAALTIVVGTILLPVLAIKISNAIANKIINNLLPETEKNPVNEQKASVEKSEKPQQKYAVKTRQAEINNLSSNVTKSWLFFSPGNIAPKEREPNIHSAHKLG